MAKCHTCGKTIRVSKGWSVGAATRRHYWRNHPEVMMKTQADKAAERALPKRRRA